MFTRHTRRVTYEWRFRIATTMMIVLALLVGCGKTEPIPTATSQPVATATPVPTNTPSPTATSAPTTTATPAPTATATESPTPTPYPEPTAGASVKTYGGPNDDIAYGILLTADGGALIVGVANDVRPYGHSNVGGDARLIKTDLEGNPIWEKDYGGQVPAAFFSMIQAGEGEYVLLGDISSPDVIGATDVFLVKIDEEGNEIWSHTYGGSGVELGRAVQQTADGGYILVGSTTSFSGLGPEIYVVKTDAQGNEMWSQAYSDQLVHLGWGVVQMSDGGYILTGFTSPDNDARDILAMKISEAGDVEWSRRWDLRGLDEGLAMTLAPDGNVVIVGVASLGRPTSTIVLLKVDPQGNEIWNKTIDERGAAAWHITATPDGGYILGGRTGSNALMLKTDAEGQALWKYTFGAEEYENAFVGPVALLPDGGYIFVGGVTPYDENPDMLWLKLTMDQKAETAASAPRYWPTDDWRSSTPEEQGMDLAKLEQMMAYIDEHDVEFDSVIVVRHGYIVLEEYFNGYDQHTKHHIQCVTKGFTSALIGIALDKGLIESVDQKMVDFFPDHPIANMDARKQQITLEHLLTMYDGLDWHEGDYPYTDKRNTLGQMWVSKDAVQYVLDRPMARDPGTEHFHNSGASILLGGILEQATGQDVYSFARKYLFDPIGIGDVQWERTTGNHRHTDGGLHMTPRDMARFGYLMLNHGTWDGQEIVSSEWVNRSTSTYHQGRYIGFGYHWFTFPETGIYAAAGHYDQWIYVIPESDMVVVFTGQIADDDPHPTYELLQDFILRSLH